MSTSRLRVAPVILFVLAACGDDDSSPFDASIAEDAGEGCVELMYARASGDVQRWPEPRLLVDDDGTATGKRFHVVQDEWPTYFEGLGTFGALVAEDMEGFDGFGINSEAFFRFTADPSGSVVGGLAVLDGDRATELESTLFVGDDDTLFIAAGVPLPEQARVVAWARATGEGCTASTPDMRSEIDAAGPEVDALVAAGAIADADELLALSVFHTGTFTTQAQRVADVIATGPAPALIAPATCEAEARYRVCVADIELRDFRGEDDKLPPFPPEAPTEVRTHVVPLKLWLPLDPVVSAPAAIFGHGLGSPPEEGEVVADQAAPAGVITVAFPALKHVGHPTFEEGSNQIDIILDFFSLDPERRGSLDPGILRDHGRQTVWERLQVLRYLKSAPDIDGDGEPDVDPDQLGYVGGSLGAIMGPQFLAGASDLRVSVLAMPGGRLGNLLTASGLFLLVFEGQRPPEMTKAGLRRFIPVAQMLIDPGDPATFGRLALREHPEPRPSVLVSVAIDDGVVPNSSSYDVARALGVPLVAPIRDVPGLTVVGSPLMANIDATTTAGLIQVDQALVDGEVVAASHLNMAVSEPALSNSFQFVLEGMEGVPTLYEARLDE